MVSPEDAVFLYQSLLREGIQIWLTGGWGIDALLGEQTRPHKDLDAILLRKDFIRMGEIMYSFGYTLKEPWSENRFIPDEGGKTTATAYVLQDTREHQFDAHAIFFDEQGNGIPAWEDAEGLFFKKEDLAGAGNILGFPVHCISPKMQIICHSGYPLPKKQIRDLELLNLKFGIEYPSAFKPGEKK
jgi:lincosamide nucleotidyltransferase A/C/D/E